MSNNQDAIYLCNNGLEVTDMQEGKVFWVKFPSGYRIIMDENELSNMAEFFKLHGDKGPGVIEMLYRTRSVS